MTSSNPPHAHQHESFSLWLFLLTVALTVAALCLGLRRDQPAQLLRRIRFPSLRPASPGDSRARTPLSAAYAASRAHPHLPQALARWPRAVVRREQVSDHRARAG